MSAYLVIGYGNELRGDDGAGRAVVDRIEALDLDGVTVRSVTQLVPELALDLAVADRVLFVDADVTVSEPVFRSLGDGGSAGGSDGGSDGGDPGALTHHVTPEVLVGLAALVGPGAAPPAVVEQLSIPAVSFELGASLSPSTAQAVDNAVTMIIERVSAPRHDAGLRRP